MRRGREEGRWEEEKRGEKIDGRLERGRRGDRSEEQKIGKRMGEKEEEEKKEESIRYNICIIYNI